MKMVSLVVGALLLAASCRPPEGEGTNVGDGISIHHLEVDDKELVCARYRAGYKGGLSCNWQAWNNQP